VYIYVACTCIPSLFFDPLTLSISHVGISQALPLENVFKDPIEDGTDHCQFSDVLTVELKTVIFVWMISTFLFTLLIDDRNLDVLAILFRNGVYCDSWCRRNVNGVFLSTFNRLTLNLIETVSLKNEVHHAT